MDGRQNIARCCRAFGARIIMPAETAKLTPPSITSVVFDLDGTLVHSSPDIAFHLNAAFASCLDLEGPFSDQIVENMIGGGLKDIIANGFNELSLTPDEALFDRVLQQYRQMYLDQPVVRTTLYDGVEDSLKKLQQNGIKIGLCTNKTEATARLVLDHFNLMPFFEVVIGGDTTPTRKPDPQSLKTAISALGGDIATSLMVGDSKADFGAARNAGCAVMLVDWGYSAVNVHDLGADLYISSYQDFNHALGL